METRLLSLLVIAHGLGCGLGDAAPDAPGAGGRAGSTGDAATSGSAGTSLGSAGSSATGAGGSDPTGIGTGGSGPGGSGTGGSDSTGGASGGGSGPGGDPCTGTIAPDDVISDFESGVAVVAKIGGRGGSWFVYNDGSAMQTPIKMPNAPLGAERGGACGSQYAFHTTGMGFSVWGAGVGATFTAAANDGGTKTSYEASAYGGIAFVAKSATPIVVRFAVPDKNTAVEGGVCEDTTDKTSPRRCGDYFGIDVQIGTEWKAYTLDFATATQGTWGLLVPTGLDRAHVFAFHAQFKGSALAPANFDLWLDNVRFVK